MQGSLRVKNAASVACLPGAAAASSRRAALHRARALHQRAPQLHDAVCALR
jgi:hypothetical protein